MATDPILPCPFCGGELYLSEVEICVLCSNVDCPLTATYNTKAEAIEAANRRSEPDMDQLRDELKEAYDAARNAVIAHDQLEDICHDAYLLVEHMPLVEDYDDIPTAIERLKRGQK